MCVMDKKKNGSNRLVMLLIAIILLVGNAEAAVVPSSSSKQTLELKPGWNLVTLTRPLDSMQGNVQKFLSLKPIRFDVNNGAYVVCERMEDLKAGIGYWVFSREKQTIELALDGTQPVAEPTLASGWNLVGKTDSEAWAETATLIWGWENGYFKIISNNELKVGHAYWAMMP